MHDNVKLGLMIDNPPVLDKPRLPQILVQYGLIRPSNSPRMVHLPIR